MCHMHNKEIHAVVLWPSWNSKQLTHPVISSRKQCFKKYYFKHFYRVMKALPMRNTTAQRLLCVWSEPASILHAMDEKECALLVLLDQLAAFSTADHLVLLSWLENRLGIVGTAVAWFKAYLTSGKQSVLIQGVSFRSRDLTFGEPIRAPFWGHYCFVCTPFLLGTLWDVRMLSSDCQLVLTFDHTQSDQHWVFFMGALLRVRAWLVCNFLKLTDTKIEFLAIGTKVQLARPGITSITIGEESIQHGTLMLFLTLSLASSITCLHYVAHCTTIYGTLGKSGSIWTRGWLRSSFTR